jgi:hypothetical protein
MNKMIVTAAFLATLAFAPMARAQDAGHFETRVVTETLPGHYEERARQVWHEGWVEIQAHRLFDGRIERVRVAHPGEYRTVMERVWIEGATRQVSRQVWIADVVVPAPAPATVVVAPAPAPVVCVDACGPRRVFYRDPFFYPRPVYVRGPVVGFGIHVPHVRVGFRLGF